MIARNITVRGVVQGVGFRPFIYRLASQHRIKGWVKNTNEAVHIFAQGEEKSLKLFIEDIAAKAPQAANITTIETAIAKPEPFDTFEIQNSENVSEAVTQVSPDIAVCEDCLYDLEHQPHRINYPLINCCHCGPRFSIIENLPYDRPNTSMKEFEMCSICQNEYHNPANRRFHAQPVACNSCGPRYTLFQWNDEQTIQTDDIEMILKIMAAGISKGKIFALKSTGGYNLICDATNENAVSNLRNIKRREGKPFAVMFRNIEVLEEYAYLNENVKQVLGSFRRPIVIIPSKKALASSVSMGFDTIGALLPYMPFHYLLFKHLSTDALVMTSGNLHDEPIIIDDSVALSSWRQKIEGVVAYNRKIVNRIDDSVIMHVENGPDIFIRRARGYVPEPIIVENRNFEGIFAAGAELTGTFAIGKANEIILSQYLGDLKNYENYLFYCQTFENFCRLFRFKPKLAVSDLHPDYHSTLFAKQLGIPLIQVQHHHAHVASAMAEHGIEDTVIGIAWDGTGLGTDEKIWGSEFLICTPQHFERFAHFEYIPLPGGDRVVDEPWRTAIAYCYTFWKEKLFDKDIEFIKTLERSKIFNILTAINKNINSPQSSSAGRLFDAVAVILGLGLRPTFHAELPMRLEAITSKLPSFEPYPFEINNNIISFAATFEEIFNDLKKIDKDYIAKKFHDTLVKAGLEICEKIRYEKGIEKVILTGGTFQNKYLFTNLFNKLIAKKFKVYTHTKIPPNDGGIALGQMYIASSQH
ncbi:MAG: carbamoyltransferase HypF [Bacteroidales bacterium]|nr:carbamoyltransferase HypF [Bacteroidales bacterium]